MEFKNFYKSPRGTVMYIDLDSWRKRPESIDFADKKAIHQPNCVLWYDEANKILYYTSQRGTMQMESFVSKTSTLTTGDIKRLLEHTFGSGNAPFNNSDVLKSGVTSMFGGGKNDAPPIDKSILNKYTFWYDNKSNNFYNSNGDEYKREEYGDIHIPKKSDAHMRVPLYVCATDPDFKKHVEIMVSKIGATLAGGAKYALVEGALSTTFAAMKMAIHAAPQYRTILSDCIDTEKRIINADIKDAPRIPYVTTPYLPHQAKTLAVLAQTLKTEDKKVALIDASMGAGKCVSGDTVVVTGNGLLTMEELMGIHKDTPGTYQRIVGIVGKEGRESASHYYVHGESETIRITTASGRQIIGTPNHRLLTNNPHTMDEEFVYLRDMQVGQSLVGSVGNNVWGSTPTGLKTKELRKLGESIANTENVAIPVSIRKAPKEEVCEFLKGFFCWTSLSLEHGISMRTLSLASYRQVMEMLGNLGIETVGSIKDLDISIVDRRSVELFASLVGFTSQSMRRDSERLLGYLEEKEAHYRQEVQVESRRQMGGSHSQVFSTHTASVSYGQGPKRVYDKVVSVEKGSVIPVFDLHVPRTHSFLANGIFNHNTLISLSDALLQIKDGHANKVAIVMPNGLIPQQIDEMRKFTNGKVNIVPVTTSSANFLLARYIEKNAPPPGKRGRKSKSELAKQEAEASMASEDSGAPDAKQMADSDIPGAAPNEDGTVMHEPVVTGRKGWKPDKTGPQLIAEFIAKAPKNTIFLVSYNFLTKNPQDMKTGKPFYPHVEMLAKAGIDSVTLDESHNIRNIASSRAKAIEQFKPHLKVRRCMTGTLAPNTPQDVLTQGMFLDMFQGQSDFVNRYALEASRGKKGSIKVGTWRPDAPAQLRADLQAQGMVSIRASNWHYMLPRVVERFHKVELSDTAIKAYETIVSNELSDEIAALLKKYEMAQITDDNGEDDAEEEGTKESSDDDEDGENSDAPINLQMQIIAKFGRLDRFIASPATMLNDPNYNKMIQELNEVDLTGPCLPEVDRILDEHFALPFEERGKVIVMTQYSDVAHAIIEKSKYADMMIYYDAGHKGNLSQFKTSDKYKILVGVSQSLREGHNLQFANRIIHVDLPWAPGSLEQANGRIHRMKSPYKRVYIDMIVADKTSAVTKAARLINKRYLVRQVTSNFKGDENKMMLRPIGMTVDNMLNLNTFSAREQHDWPGLHEYMKYNVKINEQEVQEGEELAAKQGRDMPVLFSKEQIEGTIMEDVPRVVNQSADHVVEADALLIDGEYYLKIFATKQGHLVEGKMDFQHQTERMVKKVFKKAQVEDFVEAITRAGYRITSRKKFLMNITQSAVMEEDTKLGKEDKDLIPLDFYYTVVNGRAFLCLNQSEYQGNSKLVNFLKERLAFSKEDECYLKQLTGRVGFLATAIRNLEHIFNISIDNMEDLCRNVFKSFKWDLKKEFNEELNQEAHAYIFHFTGVNKLIDIENVIKDMGKGQKFIEIVANKASWNHKTHELAVEAKIRDATKFMNHFKTTPSFHKVLEVEKFVNKYVAKSSDEQSISVLNEKRAGRR
jgi:Intein splicing domain/SNF2-related domain/Helicase conserved C-terminal domain